MRSIEPSTANFMGGNKGFFFLDFSLLFLSVYNLTSITYLTTFIHMFNFLRFFFLNRMNEWFVGFSIFFFVMFWVVDLIFFLFYFCINLSWSWLSKKKSGFSVIVVDHHPQNYCCCYLCSCGIATCYCMNSAWQVVFL